MNCRDYQRMINKLIDFEVKATESAEIFEHLGGCLECREFLDTLMKLNAELDKVRSPIDVDEKPLELPLAQPTLPEKMRAVKIAQTKFSRIQTAVMLALLVIIAGLFWTTTIPRHNEDRISIGQEEPWTTRPDYQP